MLTLVSPLPSVERGRSTLLGLLRRAELDAMFSSHLLYLIGQFVAGGLVVFSGR